MGEDWWRSDSMRGPVEQGEARLASGEEFQRHRQAQARRDEWWELLELQQGYWRHRYRLNRLFPPWALSMLERREARLKYNREWQAARRKRIRETETAEERVTRLEKQRKYAKEWYRRKKKELGK